MQFLECNQISEWAKAHGLLTGEAFNIQLPELSPTFHGIYADGRRSGREQAAAKELIHHLGTWNECVVRITAWGVWPSSEDWPKFYAWRGLLGERRSLNTAPGHLFEQRERQLLEELLTFIMENAWDANIFCSVGGRADKILGKISHDEWFEVFGGPANVG